jgi:putative transposase
VTSKNYWLHEGGIVVTYEAVRQWYLKFGHQYAKEIRRRRPCPGDTWYMDEVFITLNGECHYLRRAVDVERLKG